MTPDRQAHPGTLWRWISLGVLVATLTTVGYGDITPVTPGGRIFTTAILFIGLGIIAVPTGVVTSALLAADAEIAINDRNEKQGDHLT